MTRTTLFALLLIGAFTLMGCTPAANTANTNAGNTTNTNTAKAPAAPTAESLLELDKKATEAWMKGDTKHFEDILSAKFVSYHEGQRYDRNGEIKMIGSTKCEVKDWKLEDPQMSRIDDNTYVVSYKGTFDGECDMGGNKMKLPSPVRSSTVWVKAGDGTVWQGAFHASTPIIDPAAPPAANPPANKEEPKKDAPAANTSAANTATAPAAAPAAPSANTDALVKLHQTGWEAFKAKDAKWFSEHLASNFSFVDPIGRVHTGRDTAVKIWTETMKCEGITKVSVDDGFATAISPTVEILTLKGTADGTCDGQKNGPLYQSAVYVKEGDAWKLAFMFESPARS